MTKKSISVQVSCSMDPGMAYKLADRIKCAAISARRLDQLVDILITIEFKDEDFAHDFILMKEANNIIFEKLGVKTEYVIVDEEPLE
jgi:hypothetical protein